MTIGEAVKRFRDTGCQLKREAKSYSFGDYEACQRLLREAVVATDCSVKEFVLTPQVKQMVQWMTDTKGKGLILTGPPGTGKTMLLHTVPVLFRAVFGLVIHYTDARNLCRNDFNNLLCVDDVGTEGVVSDYGNKRDLFSELVCRAEETFAPLFLTTNLTGAQLNERYDVRITDRIVRLCRPIRFDGESQRR